MSQYDPVILHSTFARIFGHPNIQLKVRVAWDLSMKLHDPLLSQPFAFDDLIYVSILIK